MYIYRTLDKELLFRKSSTGGYYLYLNDGGQIFKIRGYYSGLAHIKRNLNGIRRFTATVKLIFVSPFLKGC